MENKTSMIPTLIKTVFLRGGTYRAGKAGIIDT